MLRRKSLISLLLVAFFMFSLVGCSSNSKGPDAAKNAPAADSAAAKEKRPDDKPFQIGFVTSQLGHSVPVAWSKGIEKEFTYFENVKYKAFDGEGKAEVQVKLMQDLINQKYDCIILQALDGAALSASVKDAEAAGIPVITMNLDVATNHAALISMVSYEAGQIAADKIGTALNGKGNVAILQCPPGATFGINREKGFRDRLAKKYPEIKIVAAQNAEWMKDKAIAVMNSFLQANDKIDGVFAINDSMAEGAALAAESAGRLKDMVIWGADGEKDALTMIEQGKLTGTVYTNCYDQGATAARLAMYLLSTNTPPKSIKNTGVIKMAPVAVTKDNVASIQQADRW